MNAATWPRDDVRTTRLLVVDRARGSFAHRTIGALAEVLEPEDLLVVNDAATLPASLAATTARGEPVEVRLAGAKGDGAFRAVLFGAGDFRTKTEDRPRPPVLAPGDAIRAGDLALRVEEVDPATPRLVTVRFDREGPALWRALYRHGRPVQYACIRAPLATWHVQTVYGARPWAVEAPSAGFGLSFELLTALRRKGVRVGRVTHAAGLSSTGDPDLDAGLPMPEAFDVPRETARAAREAKRVVAVGTTVVRALESAGPEGGQGTTSLVLGPGTPLRVVSGILTGLHEPGTSHFELLSAFAPASRLAEAHAAADRAGYLAHEHGDAMLLL